MSKEKKELIIFIVAGVIFILLAIVLAVVGYIINNDDFVVLGILLAILFCVLFTWEVISAAKKLKRSTAGIDNALLKKYDAVKDFGEVGYASFIQEGIKFSANGKFACVKDFNGISGYHFAFYIEGTELVSTPENYEDILDYKSNLFIIEIGYSEREKLTQPENDNGIVFKNISQLKGKKIQITPNNGYTAFIETVEWDEFDRAEIIFDEWNEEEHIISFKILASFGVNDVIAGKVRLLPDND